tara:strand:+ start:469 stop:747 length:279 start_codon:yes stop_codon:yes gene_type:complete
VAKDDNKLIWKALVEGANPDAEEWAGGGPLEDLEEGPDFKKEEEESPTSNLDSLIAMAASDSDEEDGEGVSEDDVEIDDGIPEVDREEMMDY